MKVWHRIKFKDLDEQITFNYTEDLYKIVNELKYPYVSEYVYYNYYYLKKTIRQIATMLELTPSAIRFWFHAWNFPTRGLGGKRH